MNTGQVDSTLVIPTYTMGNGQEIVADVKCIDESRLLVLVEQGNHRVVNRATGKVMFLLEHGYWLAGVGREPNLIHAESYIAEIKYIKSLDQLYTLSSGGVLRIYDMLSGRMLQCIPLPENAPEPGHTSITYSEINPDGTTVKYAFRDENVMYEYRVNILQELMDSVRTKTEKRVFSEIEKNEYYLFDCLSIKRNQSFIVFTLPGMRVRCTVPSFSISTS